MADYHIEHHGSIIIMQPLSAACREWLTQRVADDAQWFAGGLAVEPRYLEDLLEGMTAEGLQSDEAAVSPLVDDASRPVACTGGDAARCQQAWSIVRRYYGEGVERFLDAAGVRIVALRPGQRYGAASGALSRLSIDVDSWPAPPAGLFVVEEKTVYLRSLSAMTVCHEVGHAIDCALGSGVYLSAQAAFRLLFKEAAAFVTPYAAAGEDEAFAEGCRAFVGANDRASWWPKATRESLARVSPAIAAFIEDALKTAGYVDSRRRWAGCHSSRCSCYSCSCTESAPSFIPKTAAYCSISPWAVCCRPYDCISR